jgi:hypothetical protein
MPAVNSSKRAWGAAVAALAVLAMGLAAVGVMTLRAAERDTHQLTLRQAANRAVAAAGTYVEVTGTPNPDTQVAAGQDTLFTLQGEPRVFVFCPASDECAKTMGRFEPRAYAGRLYDGSDGAGLPAAAIADLAKSVGLPSEKDARVLRLGETLAGKRALGYLALVAAGLFLALAGALGLLVARGVLPRPSPVQGVLLP